ncbi:DNA primase/helicase protein [Rhizobium phage RHEph21]|uniref:DNA primase/helicase protein n=2 Tax=root TaxID=1 RepID=A0AAE7VMR7_9CAUD|nr:DNA primase/helicase protein [Rhizobium phage RHEph21]
MSRDLISGGEYRALSKRGITEETCRKFGYQIARNFDGELVHVAPFYSIEDGSICGQKLRTQDKEFPTIGKTTDGAMLFGQQLWKQGGRKVVVTEGEIDCMSVSQMQGNKWPVVSIPNGSKSAKKALARHLEWLCSFEEVVLMFDMDEPGRDAVSECAPLFPPGKCKVAHLPMKDANELLVAGKGDEIITAIWQARDYRPDGIVDGSAITIDMMQEPISGYQIRYPKLNDMIGGIREGELTLLTAGSGVGKSTLAREVAYGLHQDHSLTIGNIYLEENLKKTAQGYIAIHNSVPLGNLRKDPSIITPEAWASSKADVIDQRMFFYDHFGSLEADSLLAKIRYLRVALGCNFVVLDHISIVVSGTEGSGEGERRDIDKLMTKLRSLIEETGLGIIAIVHLKQPEGKPHEEGGRVTLSQLRGSGALKQLSDNIVALERDQQGENKNTSLARVLKCREFGETGEADYILYERATGRLLPIPEPTTDHGFGDETSPGGDNSIPF